MVQRSCRQAPRNWSLRLLVPQVIGRWAKIRGRGRKRLGVGFSGKTALGYSPLVSNQIGPNFVSCGKGEADI